MDFSIKTVNNSLKSVIKSGASLQDCYRLFYHIALFKYSTSDQLKQTHKTSFKVATEEKLKSFSEFGYINYNGKVAIPSSLTFKILNNVKIEHTPIDITLLPNKPEGYGDINELSNTEVFLKLIKEEYFYSLLYPSFGYLIPDALLVRKRNDSYRLEFIEIEKPKTNWKNYLETKRQNYLKLSQEKEVYDYWTEIAPKLKLPIPGIDKFKFCVVIIGNVKLDWDTGFIFRNVV